MLATASLDVASSDVAGEERSASLTWPWGGRSLSGAWVVVGALAVAYAGSHVALARGSLTVAERAARANRDYVVGLYREEAHPDGGQFQWTRGEAHLGLIKRAPYLTVRTWIQHPDAAERPVTLRISTPVPGGGLTGPLPIPLQWTSF